MKRFWDGAETAETTQGFAILLDGKPMRLPTGPVLHVPNRALAEAIAAEWRAAGGARGGEMSFADTPLTRLAGTAQDRIAPDPAPVIDAIARYGESDLLSYRAEHPDALVQRQAQAWQPWLDWAATRYGATLEVTIGFVHHRQPAATLAALHAAVASQSPATLAGLGIAVPLLGSLVLGLALAEARLSAAEAHRLAVLDELFQAELWGADDEAVFRRAQIAADLDNAARFMQFAGS